jgi:hypothetical protein
MPGLYKDAKTGEIVNYRDLRDEDFHRLNSKCHTPREDGMMHWPQTEEDR